MPYKLASFGLNEMMDCRARVRSLFDDEPQTLSEAAGRVVAFFYHELVDGRSAPACALIRFFKTHPYSDLGPELQEFARSIAGAAVEGDVRCLTLLATAGDIPEWWSPRESRGHQAIPLTSVEVVEQAPMIAQLIKQMGIDAAQVVRPESRLILDAASTRHNVFYVARALGSPYVVAQKEFVEPYGIASVVGFGGLITSGDMFATILFSKVPISAEVADLFSVIGLNLKIAILPLVKKRLFPR